MIKTHANSTTPPTLVSFGINLIDKIQAAVASSPDFQHFNACFVQKESITSTERMPPSNGFLRRSLATLFNVLLMNGSLTIVLGRLRMNVWFVPISKEEAVQLEMEMISVYTRRSWIVTQSCLPSVTSSRNSCG